MCVIIDRSPGVEIPLDKLTIACRINPNGHGLAYRHKNRIKVEYDTDVNDPEAIAAKLKRHNNKRVFLHLRYATQGDVSLSNAHPFFPLTWKEDEFDLALMHNGTLGNYTPFGDAREKKWSDTRFFTETFVRPMALRCLDYNNLPTPLHDPFFVRQMQKEIGAISVVVMFDGTGEVVRFNEERGEQFEGWWASNDYSFKETHYRNHTGSAGHYRWLENDDHRRWESDYYSSHYSNDPLKDFPKRSEPTVNLSDISTWEEDLRKIDLAAQHKQDTDFAAALASARNIPYVTLREQLIMLKQHLATAILDEPSNAMKHMLDSLNIPRPSVLEELEINDIKDVLSLPEENFTLLCKSAPAGMAQLFVELCGILDQTRKALAVATKKAA